MLLLEIQSRCVFVLPQSQSQLLARNRRNSFTFTVPLPRTIDGSANENTPRAEFGAPLTNADSTQSYEVHSRWSSKCSR